MTRTYTICLGSNYLRDCMIQHARDILTNTFPGIRFAPEEETEPIAMDNPAMFTNQVGRFTSDKSADDVKACLKALEKAAYSKIEELKPENILLDIDLLTVDDEVLKPRDMERDYIKRGMAYLDAQS